MSLPLRRKIFCLLVAVRTHRNRLLLAKMLSGGVFLVEYVARHRQRLAALCCAHEHNAS